MATPSVCFVTTGKNAVQYVSELRLDPQDSWHWIDGEDKFGDVRRMIQFRFLPVGPIVRSPGDPVHPDVLPAAQRERVPAVPAPPSATELERLGKQEFLRLLKTRQLLAQRVELRLVHSLSRWLAATHSLTATGLNIPYGAEARNLRVDLYVPDRHLLVEAKSSAAREKLRLAIGQLLDYRRYLNPVPRMCVLTPQKPADDMLELLDSLGIAAIWQANGGFATRPERLLEAGGAMS